MKIQFIVCSVFGSLLVLTGIAHARGGGASHSDYHSVNSSASLLRGSNGNNQKGGRYLSSSVKRIPGTKKSTTVTLKRGISAKSHATPEKIEAGSENIRRVSASAKGKRQHKPITVIKEWGAASPK
jgi:hypothetical protein